MRTNLMIADGEITNNELDKEFENLLDEVKGLDLNDDTNISSYYDGAIKRLEDENYFSYSVKLGSFTFIETKNGMSFDLCDTFDTLQDMHEDMKQYCIEELNDAIYTAYIERQEVRYERQTMPPHEYYD